MTRSRLAKLAVVAREIISGGPASAWAAFLLARGPGQRSLWLVLTPAATAAALRIAAWASRAALRDRAVAELDPAQPPGHVMQKGRALGRSERCRKLAQV